MTSSRNTSRLLATRLLSRLVGRCRNEALFGDLEEIYRAVVLEKGRARADWWLWLQTLRAAAAWFRDRIYWGLVMSGSTLKITLRNFRRQKTFAIINTAGLAVGMACCLSILSYVRYELGYDAFHSRADRIHRLVMRGDVSGRPFDVALSGGPVGPLLARDYPEVEKAVRVRREGRIPVEYRDRIFFEEGIFWADAEVFEVFSFPLAQGDPAEALRTPFTAVISRDTAARYFGPENPVGRTLRLNRGPEYTVTGVLAEIPANAHFSFDILLSYSTLAATDRDRVESWTQFLNHTYLLLHENADPVVLEGKFPDLIESHLGNITSSMGWNLRFALQPLRKIHLHSHLDGEIEVNGDAVTISIFASIALLILCLACMNFMNLATARSLTRAREVGVRKVLGAARGRIARQFLGESLIYSLISLVLALILVEFMLPLFAVLSGKSLVMDYAGQPWLIPGMIATALLVGLASGAYPAVVLSRFHPVRVLKGALPPGRRRVRFDRILVVFQLAVSSFLIIGTGIIRGQLDFMRNKRLGFEKEQVLIVRAADSAVQNSLSAVKRELMRVPGVLWISAASHVPGEGGLTAAHLPQGFPAEESQMMWVVNADHAFLDTLGIELVEGRNFSPEYPNDRLDSVLINQTAAEKFGWDDPLGKRILEVYGGQRTRTVIGVVKDFHMRSLHTSIEPMYINGSFPSVHSIIIRMGPGDIPHLVGALRDRWEEAVPGVPFDYSFLDTNLEVSSRTERRLTRIFRYFSILAIFIACLGLFGTACYAAERRTKELGIRKVLGASVPGLMLLLNRELLGLFGIANLIVWPVAYLTARHWLRAFAYRAGIGIWLFPASAALLLGIGILAVSSRSLKAAAASPVDTLKYE